MTTWMTFADDERTSATPVFVVAPTPTRSIGDTLARAFPPPQAVSDPTIARLLSRLP